MKWMDMIKEKECERERYCPWLGAEENRVAVLVFVEQKISSSVRVLWCTVTQCRAHFHPAPLFQGSSQPSWFSSFITAALCTVSSTMRQSFSVHQCVLFFLILTFTTAPILASAPVTAKLRQSATLLCNYKCSGLVKWTMFHDPDNILAQCDQTRCWSQKGYEMSRDQYLKGNLHLTITAVDYSNRALYTCVCDGIEACDVRLIIEPLASSVQLNPGEALVMDLPVPEPVEVMYKARGSADLYGAQICTVTQRSLLCNPEYTPRASLSYPNITLRDVNVSDSGTYSIRDRKNEEVIHIYTLIVNVVQPETEKNPERSWVIGVIVALLLFLILIPVIIVVCVVKNRHINRLKQEKAELEETIILIDTQTREVNQGRPRSNSDVAPLLRKIVDMEELIQHYKPESLTKSQSLPNLNDTQVVELLMSKKSEMEAIVQRMQNTEQDTISKWWRLKRPELDKVIEYWRNYDAELDQLKQVQRSSRASHQNNHQPQSSTGRLMGFQNRKFLLPNRK
ncbi:hypothetical protein QTP70_009990 [Hemibagrus guttatus]|uniref:Immunoglobulin domain-containing protein n=1 Tax=Hemibagrus guttatus TaxID=175788 RepID=A0AAE0UQW2_9TELE|nr:hypothetical protein QTP70_009990 [Hemibagrus guttatus]